VTKPSQKPPNAPPVRGLPSGRRPLKGGLQKQAAIAVMTANIKNAGSANPMKKNTTVTPLKKFLIISIAFV
jgi:hypothetical protein